MGHIHIIKAVIGLLFFAPAASAQLNWKNVDAEFGELPAGTHVYKTTDSIDGKPNVAYYFSAELKDKKRTFLSDTTYKRRLTPSEFYLKNGKPLLVVNTTFFSFQTNQSLNTVIKEGVMVAYNIHSIKGKGKDSGFYHHPTGSAIGISKKREADVAWLYTDSAARYAIAFEHEPPFRKDTDPTPSKHTFSGTGKNRKVTGEKWKMQTAVGGGPVLLHDGGIRVTNNEEMKFTGKAINDKHPRTAMGYTADGRLIVLVIQGRTPGIAEGADLLQQAKILKDIGCYEALNLDGGGSSCMLINGKETIMPSDKGLQRPVPAVFIVR